jgi:hypothetical protein
MNHAYTVLNGPGRRIDGHFSAFNEDFPGSRLDQSVEYVHQGAFASAIFAKDGVNRLPGYFKTYIVIGLEGPEHHGDVPHIHRAGINSYITHQDSFEPSLVRSSGSTNHTTIFSILKGWQGQKTRIPFIQKRDAAIFYELTLRRGFNRAGLTTNSAVKSPRVT